MYNEEGAEVRSAAQTIGRSRYMCTFQHVEISGGHISGIIGRVPRRHHKLPHHLPLIHISTTAADVI
jgi:hypothetical protein